MKDITLVNHLKTLAPPAAAQTKSVAGGFGEMLQQTINQVNQLQQQADQGVQQLHSGQGNNLHEVMLNLEQADISMRLLVQMRNKVVDAYHEVMRMQV